MPGIEVLILNLKLPSFNDLTKIKCVLAVGTSTQTSSFPYKPLLFQAIDSFSVMNVSILHSDKIIGGVDIPLTMVQSRKPSTFKLTDSYATPDRKKQSPSRVKNESAEITLAIKPILTPEELRISGSILEKKLEETVGMLDESYKSRKELQLSIEETTNQLSDMVKTQDNIIKQYLREKGESEVRFKELEELLDSEKRRVTNLQARVNELEQQVEVSKTAEGQAKALEKYYDELTLQSESYASQQKSFIERIKTANSEFQERCSEYQSKLDSLISEKSNLLKSIEGLQKENHQLKRENDHLSSELLKYKSRLSKIEGEVIHHSAAKLKENELSDKLQSTESLLLELKEEFIRSSAQFKENLIKVNAGKNSLIVENRELTEKFNECQDVLAQREIDFEQLAQENNRLLSDIACMEQHLCVKEDSNQIIDNLTKSLSTLREEIKENKAAMNAQDNKLSENHKKIEDLESLIKEKNEEVDVLMSAVVKLQKNREVYMPVASDPIDMALADYLNTLDDPLTVPFTREEEGIYLFGTKRIFVKLEQGKIIIRVGGGFMQVSEFIEIYTGTEVDKFSRQRAERSQKIRLSLLGKLDDKTSPAKFSQCFGIHKRPNTRSSLSPSNHLTL